MMYQLQIDNYTGEFSSVTIVGKVTCIPFNPENSDYQAYLAWLAEGNTPLPPLVAAGELTIAPAEAT